MTPPQQPIVQKAPSPEKTINGPTINNATNNAIKEEPIDEENMELDFEEISEDELEEENRIKGIGDALGVDWFSLVAESRPRIKPMSSAKIRWDSRNVLINVGVSVELAGETVVKKIFNQTTIKTEPEIKTEESVRDEPESKNELDNLHSVASIQVANREKESMRKALFASAGPYRRALSARRDLVIRRHLCGLPVTDTFVEAPKRHDPELHKMAMQLFERCV